MRTPKEEIDYRGDWIVSLEKEIITIKAERDSLLKTVAHVSECLNINIDAAELNTLKWLLTEALNHKEV